MYQIRKAIADDALGITIVNVYTWKTTYVGIIPDEVIDSRIIRIKEQTARIKSDIEQNSNFIVAVIDKTIVGFCIYGNSRNDSYKNSGEIFALYVLKGFQGMGIGKALFLAGKNELIQKNFTSLIINCAQGNPSLNFYKHMGGKVVGQRDDKMLDSILTEDIIYFSELSISRKM